MGPNSSQPPTVYVVARPNGAGKSTFALRFLPQIVRCREFLNADLIAAGLSPFAPETQNVRAGRLLLERIAELANERASFGFETTLSGRTYVKLLSDLQARGYRVELFFLWLPSAEAAVSRVANRVAQGGHNVPPNDIRRRYASGLRNLFQLYGPFVDRWSLYDASRFPPSVIAIKTGDEMAFYQPQLYGLIERQTEEFHDERN